ncbi:hypothetical protein GALMADRAFT_141013 [Galerina marginata CBS 339.88]|uniref:Uncharacterized protein n=1 Tax=Galerina marginata (strain CBS 339.88) TaxID=685588 RepID=A0A067SUT5_GALM3|nr:hypothetical protein GALMADRAFT_141013 [Galerina marginata CBS 339.88]
MGSLDDIAKFFFEHTSLIIQDHSFTLAQAAHHLGTHSLKINTDVVPIEDGLLSIHLDFLNQIQFIILKIQELEELVAQILDRRSLRIIDHHSMFFQVLRRAQSTKQLRFAWDVVLDRFRFVVKQLINDISPRSATSTASHGCSDRDAPSRSTLSPPHSLSRDGHLQTRCSLPFTFDATKTKRTRTSKSHSYRGAQGCGRSATSDPSTPTWISSSTPARRNPQVEDVQKTTEEVGEDKPPSGKPRKANGWNDGEPYLHRVSTCSAITSNSLSAGLAFTEPSTEFGVATNLSRDQHAQGSSCSIATPPFMDTRFHGVARSLRATMPLQRSRASLFVPTVSHPTPLPSKLESFKLTLASPIQPQFRSPPSSQETSIANTECPHHAPLSTSLPLTEHSEPSTLVAVSRKSPSKVIDHKHRRSSNTTGKSKAVGEIRLSKRELWCSPRAYLPTFPTSGADIDSNVATSFTVNYDSRQDWDAQDSAPSIVVAPFLVTGTSSAARSPLGLVNSPRRPLTLGTSDRRSPPLHLQCPLPEPLTPAISGLHPPLLHSVHLWSTVVNSITPLFDGIAPMVLENDKADAGGTNSNTTDAGEVVRCPEEGKDSAEHYQHLSHSSFTTTQLDTSPLTTTRTQRRVSLSEVRPSTPSGITAASTRGIPSAEDRWKLMDAVGKDLLSTGKFGKVKRRLREPELRQVSTHTAIASNPASASLPSPELGTVAGFTTTSSLDLHAQSALRSLARLPIVGTRFRMIARSSMAVTPLGRPPNSSFVASILPPTPLPLTLACFNPPSSKLEDVHANVLSLAKTGASPGNQEAPPERPSTPDALATHVCSNWGTYYQSLSVIVTQALRPMPSSLVTRPPTLHQEANQPLASGALLTRSPAIVTGNPSQDDLAPPPGRRLTLDATSTGWNRTANVPLHSDTVVGNTMDAGGASWWKESEEESKSERVRTYLVQHPNRVLACLSPGLATSFAVNYNSRQDWDVQDFTPSIAMALFLVTGTSSMARSPAVADNRLRRPLTPGTSLLGQAATVELFFRSSSGLHPPLHLVHLQSTVVNSLTPLHNPTNLCSHPPKLLSIVASDSWSSTVLRSVFKSDDNSGPIVVDGNAADAGGASRFTESNKSLITTLPPSDSISTIPAQDPILALPLQAPALSMTAVPTVELRCWPSLSSLSPILLTFPSPSTTLRTSLPVASTAHGLSCTHSSPLECPAAIVKSRRSIKINSETLSAIGAISNNFGLEGTKMDDAREDRKVSRDVEVVGVLVGEGFRATRACAEVRSLLFSSGSRDSNSSATFLVQRRLKTYQSRGRVSFRAPCRAVSRTSTPSPTLSLRITICVEITRDTRGARSCTNSDEENGSEMVRTDLTRQWDNVLAGSSPGPVTSFIANDGFRQDQGVQDSTPSIVAAPFLVTGRSSTARPPAVVDNHLRRPLTPGPPNLISPLVELSSCSSSSHSPFDNIHQPSLFVESITLLHLESKQDLLVNMPRIFDAAFVQRNGMAQYSRSPVDTRKDFGTPALYKVGNGRTCIFGSSLHSADSLYEYLRIRSFGLHSFSTTDEFILFLESSFEFHGRVDKHPFNSVKDITDARGEIRYMDNFKDFMALRHHPPCLESRLAVVRILRIQTKQPEVPRPWITLIADIQLRFEDANSKTSSFIRPNRIANEGAESTLVRTYLTQPQMEFLVCFSPDSATSIIASSGSRQDRGVQDSKPSIAAALFLVTGMLSTAGPPVGVDKHQRKPLTPRTSTSQRSPALKPQFPSSSSLYSPLSLSRSFNRITTYGSDVSDVLLEVPSFASRVALVCWNQTARWSSSSATVTQCTASPSASTLALWIQPCSRSPSDHHLNLLKPTTSFAPLVPAFVVHLRFQNLSIQPSVPLSIVIKGFNHGDLSKRDSPRESSETVNAAFVRQKSKGKTGYNFAARKHTTTILFALESPHSDDSFGPSNILIWPLVLSEIGPHLSETSSRFSAPRRFSSLVTGSLGGLQRDLSNDAWRMTWRFLLAVPLLILLILHFGKLRGYFLNTAVDFNVQDTYGKLLTPSFQQAPIRQLTPPTPAAVVAFAYHVARLIADNRGRIWRLFLDFIRNSL